MTACVVVQWVSIICPFRMNRLVVCLFRMILIIVYVTVVMIINLIIEAWSWKKINCSISCGLRFNHVVVVGSNECFNTLIHKENPTRCNSVSKFYFIFMWSSTCFGQYTAHHQEPKTALAASGFAYVEDCWTCSWWTLSGPTGICIRGGLLDV